MHRLDNRFEKPSGRKYGLVVEPVQKKSERVRSIEALGKLQIGNSAGKQKLCRVEMTPSDLAAGKRWPCRSHRLCDLSLQDGN